MSARRSLTLPRRALRRSALLGAAVTASALAVPLGAQAAESQLLAPVSHLAMDGNQGSTLLASRASVNAPATFSAVTNESLTFSAGGVTGQLAAPTGNSLSAGSTYNTAQTATSTAAQLTIAGATSCASSTGRLHVHDVARSGGALTSLTASFVYSCNGTASVSGTVRLNSRTDLLRFGTVPFDTTARQVLTVKAPLATTFGATSIQNVGNSAGSFEVVADSCSNKAIPAGGSCSVTVAATARPSAPSIAALVLPEGNSRRSIPLSIVGRETANGAYTAVNPFRALDTRSGAKLGAGGRATVQIAGRGGIPASGVSSAVVNLTVTQSTAGGWLTAWPSGKPRPTASSLNFLSKWTRANLVTVPVGADGKIIVENALGQSHVIVDVMGYYRSDAAPLTGAYGSFLPIEPTRLLDTRSDGGALVGGHYVEQVITTPSEPDLMNHVTAVAVNITAVNPTAGGYLTAFNGDPNATLTVSSLNYPAKMNVANMSIVPVTKCTNCPEPSILFGVDNVSAGSTHVLIDIVGLYGDSTVNDGLRFNPLASPQRIVDTRAARGMKTFSPGQTQTMATPSWYPNDSVSLVGNLTAVKPTVGTYVTVWPATSPATPRPTISNVNVNKGHNVANMAMPLLGERGASFFNATGTTNLLFDVAGTMRVYPTLEPSGTQIASLSPQAARSLGAQTSANAVKQVDVVAGQTRVRTR